MSKVLLYVIYHDDNSYNLCYSKLYCFKWVKFIKIKTTKYCESIFFEYLLKYENEWINDVSYEFVGMITYSFFHKIELETILEIVDKINKGLLDHIDVIGLRGLKYNIGDQSQIGIERQLTAILSKIPVSSLQDLTKPDYIFKDVRKNCGNYEVNCSKTVPKMDKTDKTDTEPKIDIKEYINEILAFFSNYWFVKPKVLQKYVYWLNVVVGIMDSDEIKSNINENSKYKLTSQKLTPIFGHPWMTWHPFILERMICIYAHLTKLHVMVIPSTIGSENNKEEFGTQLEKNLV